ncbi:TrmH family RNA methyltransferase [Kitasatospora sp. MAP5-34]|uniref:TrmH family RNA methyltransferase n=1 Tax=Kitasatospora sp. MAP5-34 TaxID=3035102 RepID=UPI00247640A4|nr:TrmH family RNA methyltransferase [Kitasatospora sp. MAP5-34]MDH6576437.1 TrmH family RNA methyltransferase [Kitasatospora sp. MAP5-34]
MWRSVASDPGAVLLEGFHALKHALRFKAEVRCVVTTDRSALIALAEALADDVAEGVAALAIEISASEMRRITPKIHPTGVVSLAIRPTARAVGQELARSPRTSPIVVLDNPRNLGNVGAVIRLAAGFGATGVVTTGTIDPWHPNVVRGSAGLHFATAVERLDPSEFPAGPLYAMDAEGSDIRSIVIPDDALLVFGSERHGVSPELRARAAELVAIPMRPQVSSFNLATSVGMGLFHWMTHSPSEQVGDGVRDGLRDGFGAGPG